jgi:hypothetical protein
MVRGRQEKSPDPIFSPHNLYLGESDEVMERLYRIRGILGFVTVLGAGVHYRGKSGIWAVVKDWLDSLFYIALFAVVAAVIAGVYLVAITHSGKRKAAAWQLRWPFIAFMGIIGLGYLVNEILRIGRYSEGWRISPLSHGLLLVFGAFLDLGLGLYLLKALYLGATSACRAADGHPLLAPVVAPLAAGAWAFKSLVLSDDSSGAPHIVHLVLTIGGPVSITVLSVVEVLRLHRRYSGPKHGNALKFPFLEGPLRTQHKEASDSSDPLQSASNHAADHLHT